MGLVSYLYKKHFVTRYDKEVGVPYYATSDFKGLKEEAFSFTNSKGIELKYFYYYYDNYKEDKVVLFLHGLACGHFAYFAEIDALARRGYKVLTIDYTGCGDSNGKCLGSLNTPTRDVNELLDYLKLDKPLVIVGHSLGGYTALNVINLRKDIKKTVVISGFLTIKSIGDALIKNNFFVKHILKYESKLYPEYKDLNNVDYLNKTTDDIFFIQSDDDTMVPYRIALEVVEQIDNPHIKKLKLSNRKHNPNYTD
ncbi:MAG: alpha/beta hydrolase, partial [Bacilli bacterium]|nr:alpha/beta hydrolase [Bacilli bacterium]